MGACTRPSEDALGRIGATAVLVIVAVTERDGSDDDLVRRTTSGRSCRLNLPDGVNRRGTLICERTAASSATTGAAKIGVGSPAVPLPR
jgi:hypothetical protein